MSLNTQSVLAIVIMCRRCACSLQEYLPNILVIILSINKISSIHSIFSVHLEAPDSVLVERYSGKRVDPVTGGKQLMAAVMDVMCV